MNDLHEHEGEGQLGWFFWRARAAYPHKTAVIDVSQGYERRITFAALDAAMNRVANLLVSAGLKPGDRMGLGMSNRWEFFAAMFGAMRAGVVPVPMNIKQAPDVLAYILADAGAKAALIEPAVNARLAEAANDVPIKLALGDSPAGWSDFWTAVQTQPSEFQPLDIMSDDPAFHPYTSGSTGRPKGMTLTHGNTTWLIEIRQKHWPARMDQRGLIAAPLYHKNAMTCLLYTSDAADE